jgi:hypothetical protein
LESEDIMLKTVEFILNNNNWEELLSGDPYNIRIKRKDSLVMFNYTQGISEPCEIVNECRGLILDESDNFKVIRYGLYRFYNHGETAHAEIDTSSMQVMEKIDGSLVMFYYYNNRWHHSTRSTFDSVEANIGETNTNFAQLIERAIINQNIDVEAFDKNLTYVFELVSPESQIIVHYDETKLYFLMARDMTTFEEVIPYNVNTFTLPKLYEIKTLDDAIKIASEYDGKSFEGFVVKDKFNNRLKVKNTNWLRMHKMFANGRITDGDILSMILAGDDIEYLSYFPENTEKFNEVRNIYYHVLETARKADSLNLAQVFDRKTFAKIVKNSRFSGVAFSAFDGKAEKFVRDMKPNKFVEMFIGD